ncbi:MAG: NAD(P)-dependent oxidoreductase [Actinobacteria bacterium ATB1]|nr:NAD(P)-dependent oxidoreductase [Actinobacteria bacterium ATB1]
MRVMVTGSAGYIGMPLVEALVADGHEVVGYDLKSAPHTRQADIRELAPDAFEGIDSIVHLAGVSFAPEWTDTDDLIWDANCEGTRRMIEHAEEAGVPRFVFASSASIFEGNTDEPARLLTRPMPVSAYGRSKASAERILKSSTIPVRISLRKGTICGLGPNPRLDLVLNAMTLAAMRRGQVFVDGEGMNNRPMLRLSRAVRTYAAAATSDIPEGFHLYNICDDNVSIVDLATEVCKHTGAELVHREYTGRPRSYIMYNEGSDQLLDQIEESPIGIEGMVKEVHVEFELSVDSLPQVSADPRLDRLDQINREMRAQKADKDTSSGAKQR